MDRADAGTCLLARYKAMKPEDRELGAELWFVEVLLAQPEVTANCDQGVLLKIVGEAQNKLQRKEEQYGACPMNSLYFAAAGEHRGSTGD